MLMPYSSSARQYAALFDLDGVIIDTRAATRAALLALAGARAQMPVNPSLLDACVAMPPVDALMALDVPDARHVYRDYFDDALATAIGEVRVFDEVVDGISVLREQGAGIGIVTAQARDRLRFLLPENVAEIVDIVIAHEDAAAKPSPEGVLTACTGLGVRPDQAFFLGDTPTDIAAGRAAGVWTYGAAWGLLGDAALINTGAYRVLTEPGQVGLDLLAPIEVRPGSGE
ncbi:HAD-IA family hydrolase [Nocardia puris]|uniref:HAD family hydrolase n=1 Tax=Nocardia puris TaxID=208602 RepID=UPI001895B538|nr:HAD-IA family hydrolase [Nocardia puris]MBF6216300.1 HAD-IA family hydrolase [Nocardia puris]